MDRLCKDLTLTSEWGLSCVNWFRQAIEHCAKLFTEERSRPVANPLWAAVKDYIFPEKKNDVLNLNMPISLYPDKLTKEECQTLLFNIADDYILRAPLYLAEIAANERLKFIITTLSVTCLLGSLIWLYFLLNIKFGTFLRTKIGSVREEELCEECEQYLQPEDNDNEQENGENIEDI